MANRELRTITQRLSLRPPQEKSLEILAQVLDAIRLEKGGDPAASLDLIHALYPGVTDFEREFPSLCFALATGVGKTRLMGAFIAYLYLTGENAIYILPVHHECRPMWLDDKTGLKRFGEPQELTALNAVASTYGCTGAAYASGFMGRS